MRVERLLKHVVSLDDVLNESEKAALGVVPRVGAQFFTDRVERLHNEPDPEVKVAL